MPPRPKFTRDDVVNAAYRIMEARGIDAVVAREVGKELGATVAPIFTYFKSMEELKKAVYDKALQTCGEYLADCTDYFPSFKEFGLRWVRYAKEHPNAYSLVFLKNDQQINPEGFINRDFLKMVRPIQAEIVHAFALSEENAEMLMQDMCIYAQGLASMHVVGHTDYSEEKISIILSRLCLSYVAGYHIQEGKLNVAQLRDMMEHMDMKPTKRNEIENL